MIPATHGGLRYGSCPHCAQQPEHCLDPSSCALCRCDFCEGRRLPQAEQKPSLAKSFVGVSLGEEPGSALGAPVWDAVDTFDQRVTHNLNHAAVRTVAGLPDPALDGDVHGGLLGSGAAGFAGGADFRLSDPKGCCQRKDGGAARGCLSVDQPGNGVRAQAGSCAPCGQTALLDDAAEQLSEGLDRLSLCHGETLSGIEEEKLGTLLDILDESDESAQVKNAPGAANLGGATAPGAEPRA